MKLQTRHAVTITILLLNVLVFAGMALRQGNILFNRPDDYYFMLWSGANFNPFTLGGEYWRLFTSMFMHWGIIHLAVNMYALFSIGRVLEPFLGTRRFIMVYLITGIAAGIASLVFNLYPVSAGASGAIMGLFGYMVVWQAIVNFRDRAVLGRVLLGFGIFVVVNYAIAQSASVDTPAHIGGFAAGAVLAVLNFFYVLTRVAHLLAVTLMLPFLVLAVPKDKLYYYETFQELVDAEDGLQRVYGQMLTDNQRRDSLQSILPAWDSVQSRLEGLAYVDEALHNDTSFLHRYISLRIREINYRLTGYDRETYVYLDSIELIQLTLDSLPGLEHPLNFRVSEPPAAPEEPEAAPGPAPEVIKVYYDSVWREIDYAYDAAFFRIGRRDSLQRWQGDVRDYYVDGTIQMKGKYLNGMHDGIFRYYTKDGGYESLGRYDKNEAVGKWENYYPNGLLQSEVYYGSRSYTKSVFDSLGHAQVVNGNGRQVTWHANGQVAEEGEYKDGLKQGYWYGYHASGKPYYQELYRDNLLIRGVAMTEDGRRYVYDQLSVFPFPKMGMEAYKKYLEENLRRPPEARHRHGEVKVTFLVDKDGEVRDFVVTESLCIPCDEEAIRLVKEGPPWRPGVLRGQEKIRMNGYVEVNF